MDNIELAGLNTSFELQLIESLVSDIEPISRLAAYLCLKYHIQAMIKPTWGDSRPVGFYDMLRNIFIVTDENDADGLMTLELRVFLPAQVRIQPGRMLPIPEVPFEQVGSLWCVESARIQMQLQQLAFHEQWEYNTDVDPTHPLIKAFERIGLHLNPETEPVEMEPGNSPVTVDSTVEAFLANKPGAKLSPASRF